MEKYQEYVFENIKDFSPKDTFECGQCFRWEAAGDHSYTGIAWGRPANIRLAGDKVYVRSAGSAAGTSAGGAAGAEAEADGAAFWRRYLDLDRDYGAIKARLAAADPVVAQAIKSGEGIRILRQAPWETIVSFIISANNNIPRIKGCIERLAGLCGTCIGEFEGKTFYELPAPKVLASMEPGDLAPAGLGYRAAYLVKTARQVTEYQSHREPEPANHPGGPTEQPHASEYPPLRTLAGVGPKVESCIRLFGFADYSSFPIDVWVRRVMHELYGFDEKDISGMKAFAEKTFGEYGGIAQQYLFYHMRELGKK